MRRTAALLMMAALVAGCTDAPSAERPGSSPPASPSSPSASTPAPVVPDPPTPRVSPDDVRVGTATAAVRHLADRVGPRPGTSPAYFRAAAWVQRRFQELGWQVERQRFPTPAGYSWNGPVDAGPSVNVLATRGDVRPGEPWLVVGAHLDTVVGSPGAEDNASGVGVLLAVAEALAGRRTRLPVVLVAFGSEEPRGQGDAHHHYGSRAYVAALTLAQRRSVRGMVSLDRVGVGAAVPVGSPGDDLDRPTRRVLAAARRAGVPTLPETGQRSSDHWSFARDGMPGVRLGSTPYAGYHSAGDVPAVVEADQLERTARVVLAWLR
ncbi:MAG TPA: M28 family peptidase [Nocardioides sp.]|uniref:M28 family metallopeptidase n=1 Tax=Nocardioides sp. TaxID=35761 RepID=UPI002D184196|nr:M28 family peptidase [Nocardioides sp.]HTW17612.1 M28 family peptidase [Nocardioides sp.]